MKKQSTKTTLMQMQRAIEHYDPQEWFGVTLDDLRNDFEVYKDVANTLSFREMRLIGVLRGCRVGETQRFLTCAENLYKALCDCDRLAELTPPK